MSNAILVEVSISQAKYRSDQATQVGQEVGINSVFPLIHKPSHTSRHNIIVWVQYAIQ